MIEHRDSKGHFIKGNVPWNKRQEDRTQKGMASLVVPKMIGGGVLELERIQVICPACGQQVEAVASDGQIRGYCAVARQYVDFLTETEPERKKWWLDPEYQAKQIATHTGRHPTTETRAKLSAMLKERIKKG